MPRYNQPRKTWCYTNEFKAKAVQLSLPPNIQVQEVAHTLDIHPLMLSRCHAGVKNIVRERQWLTSARK